MRYKHLKSILTRNILYEIECLQIDWDMIQEIRLRANQPLILRCKNQDRIINYRVQRKELLEVLQYISSYSLHAYENELRQGFITIEGGHRVGMAGQVLLENGQVKNLKNISSMNIRVSHEIKECANAVMPFIMHGEQLYHTLIVSPPKCGKTTLLRDIVRQVSQTKNIGMVDERSEIAACYQGIPQNNVGQRTDVLDGCPKKEGMLMLVRSMSPDVIAVDEIGAQEEVEAMKYAMHCGVKMLATVHGRSMEEIRNKPLFDQLVKEHCFERYVVLTNRKHVGEVFGIYDERGSVIYREVNECY